MAKKEKSSEAAPLSPVPPKPAVRAEGGEGYQFVIKFNGQAQLTDVSYPSDMDLVRVNHHLAVAMLFLAEEMAKGERD